MLKAKHTNIKSRIVTDAFLIMGKYAYQLLEKGASLRLLSGLLCMPNYGSVYKRLIDKNKDMQRDNRRGVTRYEKDLLVQWQQANPLLADAMKVRGITPRRWCCVYGLITDANYADLTVLINPQNYEDNSGKPYGTILSLLREDFPEAFGLKAGNYRSAEVDPDLYFHYKKTYSRGAARHIFWLDPLDIKVINRSDFIAYTTYKKRLLQEIRIKRIAILLELGLTPANIMSALAWLPEDVSKFRPVWGAENQGEGHKAMRAAEQEYLKRLAGRGDSNNSNH